MTLQCSIANVIGLASGASAAGASLAGASVAGGSVAGGSVAGGWVAGAWVGVAAGAQDANIILATKTTAANTYNFLSFIPSSFVIVWKWIFGSKNLIIFLLVCRHFPFVLFFL